MTSQEQLESILTQIALAAMETEDTLTGLASLLNALRKPPGITQAEVAIRVFEIQAQVSWIYEVLAKVYKNSATK